MAADLTFGSVPPLYRELYDMVCPNQESVDRDLFVHIMVKTSLPKETVMQIWGLVSPAGGGGGGLTRTGLYKALALTGLAQQGKPPSDKLLENYGGQELPKPSLGDLSDLRASALRLRRERNPQALHLDYKDLRGLDSVEVDLVPGKKGIILKHVEYQVSSQRHKTKVQRRYNDFASLHELLSQRYPYRMVPRLPPKKIGASREFIEQRKKSLGRYLNLVSRHPQMHDDPIVNYFLTFSGNDVQHKIKEQFRHVPDEFMTSDMASKAKDLVPMDTQQQLGHARQHVGQLHTAVCSIKRIAESLVVRATTYAQDMMTLGKTFSSLSGDTTPVTSWATGPNSTWPSLQHGFSKLAVHLNGLSDTSAQGAVEEEDGVVERLAFFLDLINSYMDLCERHEKGVLHEHQKAIQKMGQYKKRQMSATVSRQTSVESGAVEQLEQRILEQEGQIANMENRNYYSLHCLQMETQLVHQHLALIPEVMAALVDAEAGAGRQLSAAWAEMRVTVEGLSPASSATPRLSPVGAASIQPGQGISV